jgi:hypothetical protein
MAAPATFKIDVVGLKGFQAALRQADALFPRQLRVANLAAAHIVADATEAAMEAGPGAAPLLAPTVKALAQQRSASVGIGGKSGVGLAAMGVEFGGGLHGKGNPTPGGGYTTQFLPWRGRDADAGYYLFPQMRQHEDEIVEAYGDMIDDLMKQAFPN